MPKVLRLRTIVARYFNITNEKANLIIGRGSVRVDGKVDSPASKIENWQAISVDDKIIRSAIIFSYIKFYKPSGIECTLNPKIDNNLLTVFKYPQKLFPVGRLDKDSEGLLLMTDDGRIFNQVAISERHKEKEYLVTLDRYYDNVFLEKMSNGIVIMGKLTRSCKLIAVTEKSFRIILTQGMNRQIRRMCYKLGYQVLELIRIRIVNVELGDLKVGTWKELTNTERLGLS